MRKLQHREVECLAEGHTAWVWAEPGFENRQAGSGLHTLVLQATQMLMFAKVVAPLFGKKCPISLKFRFSVCSKRSHAALGLCRQLPGQALNLLQSLRKDTKGWAWSPPGPTTLCLSTGACLGGGGRQAVTRSAGRARHEPSPAHVLRTPHCSHSHMTIGLSRHNAEKSLSLPQAWGLVPLLLCLR